MSSSLRATNGLLRGRNAVLASASSRSAWSLSTSSVHQLPVVLISSPHRLGSSVIVAPKSNQLLCPSHSRTFPCSSPLLWSNKTPLRFFQTESDYHTAANETLEDIQDAVEEALEEKGVPEFEVTFASGVLTMVFPPHGTWVINKQTPNRQIWWSSPVSGPRRYEYEDGEWVYTRDDSHSMTLDQALREEIQQIYDVEIDL